MDSWINQDVNLGRSTRRRATTTRALTVPWQLPGVADVLTCGTRYQATQKLSFTGEFEYVHGMNSSSAVVSPANQTPALARAIHTPYDLGQYSLVKMQSFRFGAGADYILRPRVTTYVRYNYYDYQDDSGTTSGQANMILGGMSATF